MKKHRLPYMVAGAVLFAALFTGCTNERLEDELDFRKIGINSMQSGDYEGAVAAFNSALSQCVGKITDTELDICYYKAAAQYAGGDIEGALATYQAMIDYDEENGNAYYLHGCLSLKQQDTDTAKKDFANAVKYNPDDYELYVGIYENLAGNNMTEEGEEYLNKAFDIKGNSAENLTWRGRFYYLLGQYDNAVKELEGAVKKDSAKANLYLAQVYEAEEDSANAEKYYQAYVDSGTADSVAMNVLAEIQMEKGNYEAALEDIRQGLAMDNVTNQQELLPNQIIAYEYSGDFSSAWDVVQQYVSLYPDDEAAQREYIFLKNRQNTDAGSDTESTDSSDEGQNSTGNSSTDDSSAQSDTTNDSSTGDSSAENRSAQSDSTGDNTAGDSSSQDTGN